jgi:hypothetical protein
MSKRQHKKSYKERMLGKKKDFLKRAYNNREFKLDYDAENVEINSKSIEKYKKILDKANSTRKNKENRKSHEK